MNRLAAVVYIVFCFELGVILFVLPWTPPWTKNYFVGHYAPLATVAHNYFLRGAISGLGLADVWLAFFELWRLRRDLGIVKK